MTADTAETARCPARQRLARTYATSSVSPTKPRWSELAEQKLDEKLEDDAAAAEKAAEAQTEAVGDADRGQRAMDSRRKSRSPPGAPPMETLDFASLDGRRPMGIRLASSPTASTRWVTGRREVPDELDIAPADRDARRQRGPNMPDEAQAVLESLSGFREQQSTR